MESGGAERTLSVGFNKLFGVVLLVLALLCVGVGLMAKTPSTVLIGGLNTLLGVLYLVRPYFVVGPRAIELKNLLGMTMRRYVFVDLGALEVGPDGKSVFHIDPGGARTRLKLTRWLADGADWRRFLGLLQARAFE